MHSRTRTRTILKPGWIARAPGAVLRLRFRGAFRRVDPAAPAAVSLSYLRSYEHMGAAELACEQAAPAPL